jgi:GT2 family glycosyltransferase
MQPRPDVAVVIVSYNTRNLTLRSIASAIESAQDAFVEIIVVDNASEDESVEAIKTAYPLVTVIANQKNVGFGAACNQAINSTRAPLTLLLNSDARLTAEAFTALCDVMRERARCGAAGCNLLDDDGRKVVRARNFLTPFNQALEYAGLARVLKWRAFRRVHRPRLDEKMLDCSVDWIDGACLLLRREALDEVGLFDERFFMYSEDEDLCFRLKQKGWKVCYSEAGTGFHRGAASSSQIRVEMLRQFYLSQMLFLFKHSGRPSVSIFNYAMKSVFAFKRLLKKSRRHQLGEHLAALKQAYSSHAWRE